MDELSEVNLQKEDMLAVSDEDEAQKSKYMTFKSGNEYFGLKIQYVNEIIQIPPITAIPRTGDYIKGLINLRGKSFRSLTSGCGLSRRRLNMTTGLASSLLWWTAWWLG